VEPPYFKGYVPYGRQNSKKGFVELLYEEHEAIKPADYHLLAHHEACLPVGISRATFARIYGSAKIKIAKAMVEAKEIRTTAGEVFLDHPWFHCDDFHTRFPVKERQEAMLYPNCSSSHLESLQHE
jgi:predicted DNA-binding protein (UPF0251 family)